MGNKKGVKSAGVLVYKKVNGEFRYLLAHPGGPFYKNKDERVWDIPKGVVENGEDLFIGALRELKEETGIDLSKRSKEEFIDLGSVIHSSGKEIFVWAVESGWHGLLITSSYVELEYPRNSGKKIKFPEIDKANFFKFDETKKKIRPYLFPFVEKVREILADV